MTRVTIIIDTDNTECTEVFHVPDKWTWIVDNLLTLLRRVIEQDSL